ncbi:MAG TPA: adenosine kinase [Bacteroidales bacterium]|nr:adenosine kinase [Bacteroidales bacterium]
MKKILGIGNALTDILLKISDNQLEQLQVNKGSMQLVDGNTSKRITTLFQNTTPAIVAGGSTSNTICGMASLGAPAAFLGKIGDDAIGKIYEQQIIESGAEPLLHTDALLGSGNCTVLVTPDGERTMCTYLGAACNLQPHDITEETFDGYQMLHLEGYLVQNHKLIEKAMRMAHEAKLIVSIDLASYNIVNEERDFMLQLIRNYVDIVFANEMEAKAIAQTEDPDQALNFIYDLLKSKSNTPKISIVKLGAQGSLILSDEGKSVIDAIKVQCVDSTGAGDLYAAGFLFGIANKMPVYKCGQYAALVASKVIQTMGSKISVPIYQEILQQIDISI